MQTVSYQKEHVQVQINEFIRSVYNWMAIGLAITGFIAFFVAASPGLSSIILGTPLMWVLLIGELGLVFYLSSRIQKIQASTATSLFIFFSALNGATLSSIFLVYNITHIQHPFL